MRRLGCAVAGAIAALAPASPASAGQYELHSCRLPDGRAIPAFGWLGAYGNGEWLRADDTCAQGGALSAALTGVRTYEHPQGAFALWRLEAPPGTAIRRVRGHFAFSTSAGRDYGSPVVDAEGYERQGRFGIGPGSRSGSFAAWNDRGNERDTGPITATRGFRMVVRCVGGGASCPYGGEDTGRADIFRAQTTLEDLGDPAVQRIGGPVPRAGRAPRARAPAPRGLRCGLRCVPAEGRVGRRRGAAPGDRRERRSVRGCAPGRRGPRLRRSGAVQARGERQRDGRHPPAARRPPPAARRGRGRRGQHAAGGGAGRWVDGRQRGRPGSGDRRPWLRPSGRRPGQRRARHDPRPPRSLLRHRTRSAAGGSSGQAVASAGAAGAPPGDPAGRPCPCPTRGG